MQNLMQDFYNKKFMLIIIVFLSLNDNNYLINFTGILMQKN